MLRSELDLYRSLHGDIKERTESQPVDTDVTASRVYPSTLETSNLTAPSGPLSTTVIRQNVMTPLMIAAQQGSLRECKNNMQYVRQQLPNGMTALMFAASAGNKEIVELLAPHECSFIRHDNMCAAEVALTCGHYDCAELLRVQRPCIPASLVAWQKVCCPVLFQLQSQIVYLLSGLFAQSEGE